MTANFSAYFWGFPSATVDWCEENYEKVGYAAEFYNSLSSLFFVWLAIFGLKCSYEYGYTYRGYILAYAMLALVGFGSAAFHATLLYEMQLLDELPMIYGATTMIYLAIDPKDRYSLASKQKIVSLLCLVSMAFTLLYVFVPVPVLQHSYFGLLILLFIILTVCNAVQLHYVRQQQLDRRGMTNDVRNLFLHGFFYFLLGSCFWGVDNHFCTQLQYLRTTFTIPPLDIFFQFHSLWHLFSGLGLYYLMILCFYVREASQGRDHSIFYLYRWVPFLKPVQSGFCD